MDGSQRIKDSRGSSYDRRARRAYLIAQYGSRSGKTVRCFHCHHRVHAETFEVDRFPRCGHLGGRYTRDNIVPACTRCNGTRCRLVARCRRKERLRPERASYRYVPGERAARAAQIEAAVRVPRRATRTTTALPF